LAPDEPHRRAEESHVYAEQAARRCELSWGGFAGYGDILECNIPQGRCILAAKGPPDGYRIVPHLDVPN
jgi:hypothetical protein